MANLIPAKIALVNSYTVQYLGVGELVAGLHGVEGVVDGGQPHVRARLTVHRHLHALARAVLAVVDGHREL